MDEWLGGWIYIHAGWWIDIHMDVLIYVLEYRRNYSLTQENLMMMYYRD